MQTQIAISAALSILSLIFACVMLAGSSDNCDVLRNVRWGSLDVVKASTFYIGTKGMCVGDSDEFYKYTSEVGAVCRDAGKIATGFTALTFILTVMTTAISMVRLNAKVTAGGLKVASMVLPIVAIIADIIAIGRFDHKCLNASEMDADPSVGIIMGSVMVFFLTFITILHAVAN